MDYLVANPKNHQALGAPSLDSLAPGGWRFSPHNPFRFNNQKYVQDPTPILHTRIFYLMQILGNFGAKRNLYFIFSAATLT